MAKANVRYIVDDVDVAIAFFIPGILDLMPSCTRLPPLPCSIAAISDYC